MSNNKQPLELTEITVSSPGATQGKVTQGLSMEDRDASTSTPIIDKKTIHSLLECAEIGENRGNERPPSICKVSRILRDHNESSYEPQLVSIGPMHRENMKLKEFEWQKKRYLGDLLRSCDSTPKEILEACLGEVNSLISKIRESYACVIENCSDDELAGMMVMDGCFILEFCFKHQDEDLYLPNKMQNLRIAMDLMLLENQVPFSVLQALFDCLAPYIFGEKGSVTLSYVLDRYLAPYIKLFRSDLLSEKKSILGNVLDKYLAPYIKLFCSLLHEKFPATDVHSDSTNVHSDSTHEHDHVLGYLHKCYQLVAAKSSNPIYAEASTFHSIVELDRSGMNFKPHHEDVWSMTIKFQSSSNKPTLLMPTLVIGDTTEQILRNFIAYEQLFRQDRYYFTSYAHAMDMLIDTQEDIAKLVESKVLVNRLGSNQEAADMINKMCKNTFATDFYYIHAFEQMDKYYNGWSSTYIAWLKRAYTNNPFFFIAITAAIILFLLTVVQTVFTVLGYFADGSNQ